MAIEMSDRQRQVEVKADVRVSGSFFYFNISFSGNISASTEDLSTYFLENKPHQPFMKIMSCLYVQDGKFWGGQIRIQPTNQLTN